MKMYSPSVLDALVESLRTIYWYKPDLKSFLVRTGVPESIVQSLKWDAYKRDIARQLIDQLAIHPASGKEVLDHLIDAVVEQDEAFPHLDRLDDGKRKVADAAKAVRALKELLGRETIVARAEKARHAHRTESIRAAELAKQQVDALKLISEQFLKLCQMQDRQRRGFDLQTLLRDLFALHDLDPRGSFARPGEQIDGSITLDGTVLLVEAKWTDEQAAPKEVRDFRVKVHDKLDNTLGLMLSMSGFTEQAIEAAAGGGRMLVILMDGEDLARICQGLDDLAEVLRRKLRRAAEEGRPFHKVGR